MKNKDRYPENWSEISKRIRQRDGNKCAECGVKNKAVGARDRFDVWHDETDIDHMNSGHGINLFGEDYPHIIRIVLTVHHIGIDKPDGTPGDADDKMDCRDENLISLCNRCHLRADTALRVRKTKATKHTKKHAGQLVLFGEEQP